MQKWDEKTAGAYFGSEILQGGEEVPEETASAADDAMEQMMPRFTEGLSWTFTDVKEEGDSAAITAEITNRDLGALIAAFLQEAFSQMMSTIFLPGRPAAHRGGADRRPGGYPLRPSGQPGTSRR